ncbi:MAG: 23S rRNA (adenine(2503)-C(2))-methyltransferase RlmN [Chthoniobacterales bacterium]
MNSIKSLTLDELTERFVAAGEPGYRAKQVIQWLYEKRVRDFRGMTNLPAALRDRLTEEYTDRPLELVRTIGSVDTTRKFLFRLNDGQLIETVLIPASRGADGDVAGRRTLCVSSQVGCAYGCRFCASGLDGWKRNLDAGEIVDQLLQAEEIAGERVDNIVFMGMGEPFANFEQLMKAVTIINAPWGPNVGARHVTVSTSGLAPRIRDLADQPLQVRLAVSLHGATDEVRDRIMPVNRKHPLEELLAACAYFCERKKQKITFEYILIEGVNDSTDQAIALSRLVRKLNAKVNLIPYNTVDGLEWVRPAEEVMEAFVDILHAGKVAATLRREKGHDISAACGQLRLQTERVEKPVADATVVL